jgi:tyrosine-specific transport protein
MFKNLDGIFIVISSCIGAGILGMPVVCNLIGIFPSIILMFLIALYMLYLAKIIVKLSFYTKTYDLFLSIDKILGKNFKLLSFVIFIFLFLLILSAYISKCGDLLHNLLFFFNYKININLLYILIISLSFIFINLNYKLFNKINKIITIFIIIFFLMIIFIIYNHLNFDFEFCFDSNYKNIKLAYPLLLTSFGFHNILSFLQKDNKNINIIYNIINNGIIITFFIYIIWIIFTVPLIKNINHNDIFKSYNEDKLITEIIITQSKSIFTYLIISAFTFVAIITSILNTSLSMKLFLNIIFKNNIIINSIIFIPPFIINIIHKNIFFSALEISGSILALVLFGFLPIYSILKLKIKNKKSLFKIRCLGIITLIIIILSIVIQINK